MNLDNIIAKRSKKTIYRDGDKVIKMFDSDYSKSDVLNEALNQSRIENIGLDIPRILEVTTIDGKWAIVLDYIEGKTLAQLMEENPDKFDEYLEMFIDLQIKVHSCKSPLLNKLRDKMRTKIMQADLDATTRYDLQTRLESHNINRQVCHGDFNPSNIIVTDEGKMYVLDWSHVTQGNASADVARTYLLFCLKYGNSDIADKYLKEFCAKVNIPIQNVQKWLPIVAASQSVKGNTDERKFLLSWVDVVDYE